MRPSHALLSRSLLPATCLVLLAGCAKLATPPVTFQRAATSPEQTQADLDACAAAARAQANREQANLGLAGQPPTDVGASLMAFDTNKRAGELTQRCMVLHGYEPVKGGQN
jgi:hypothetical protein